MSFHVVLIGPPGSGKSSVGRALSKALQVDFVDTDVLIEEDQKKSVAQIFIDEGEPHFRAIEERICCEAISRATGIISLGGGAVLSLGVQDALLNSHAKVVFLDVTLSVAAPRVGFNRDRPLLLTNPRAQWQQLMDARRPIYESLATITCEVGDLSVAKIVDQLLAKVSS
ncbi:unannotated protein [freshwater metagenome]|uniref:Unannotated protein n=1 Tax=freshwater metagenome TaxID=449393 RepID=A0A6J5ZPS5_9ZZZZ|nr:shikimate kinase [Actinomycetota bacterium]MSV64591.1 AAA family ATPase [Actinomycetota bacterium]MSW26631.1 AAA family ATPase [Actinomycetota bacterium]MSW34393.1 AAA family ATPase [Actinomycetota bacterium]MSX31459.1 AAA family ATPase [Actinomycetota bacterium]